jgi:hypothetical protein
MALTPLDSATKVPIQELPGLEPGEARRAPRRPTLGLRLAAAGRAVRAGGRSTMTHRVLVGVAAGLAAYQVAKGILWATQLDLVVDLVTGADHAIYMAAADRIRAGGPLYPAHQLAGPYVLASLPELYPPMTIIGLIVPMSFLPGWLWWALPLGIIAGAVLAYRPSVVGWVAILAFLTVPHTWTSIAAGNPALYSAAAVALGTRWRWLNFGAIVKPTLLPFALLGIRSRWWWVAVAAGVALILATLPAWLDYLTALRNLSDGGGVIYSIQNVPLLLIPVAAYLTRRQASP